MNAGLILIFYRDIFTRYIGEFDFAYTVKSSQTDTEAVSSIVCVGCPLVDACKYCVSSFNLHEIVAYCNIKFIFFSYLFNYPYDYLIHAINFLKNDTNLRFHFLLKQM